MTENSSQMQANDPSQERVVVAHTADTAAEAMVIRGLLESAGITRPVPLPPTFSAARDA